MAPNLGNNAAIHAKTQAEHDDFGGLVETVNMPRSARGSSVHDGSHHQHYNTFLVGMIRDPTAKNKPGTGHCYRFRSPVRKCIIFGQIPILSTHSIEGECLKDRTSRTEDCL